MKQNINNLHAAVAERAREFTSHAEDWVLESLPRQAKVVKAGNDSSTGERSALGESVTDPRR